jgi:hypothetical protein
MCSQRTPNVQIKFFMFDWSIYRLFVQNKRWKRDSFQVVIFVDACSTWRIVELKTCFETRITRKDVNGLSLFHLPYLITLMAYRCSQRKPNVQINYFMFHWTIYRLFVLNARWKRDSFQRMIFENDCSAWNMVKLKTRFETWITINDVSVVSLFHLTYLITFMSYLRSQRTPNVQI